MTGLVIIHLWIAAICYTKVDAFNLKSQNSPDLLPKFQGLEGKTEEQALAVGLISGGGRGGLLISSAFWKLCNYKQGGREGEVWTNRMSNTVCCFCGLWTDSICLAMF